MKHDMDFQISANFKSVASRVKGRRVYVEFKKVACAHVLRRVKVTKTLNKGEQINVLVGLRKLVGESATRLTWTGELNEDEARRQNYLTTITGKVWIKCIPLDHVLVL